jgi:EAL domain-containing protein (putative c-di-GMP-specific phosphodiesterase class I)
VAALTLYAQLIVDLQSGRTVQHELLVRMIGLSGEVIAPGDFLPVAEQHGLIGEIDRAVFEMAMTYAGAGHRVQINVSAQSISDPAMFGFVRNRIGLAASTRSSSATSTASRPRSIAT